MEQWCSWLHEMKKDGEKRKGQQESISRMIVSADGRAGFFCIKS